MTVATDAVFELPDDGDNEGPRASRDDDANITDLDGGPETDTVGEDNVPRPALGSDDTE